MRTHKPPSINTPTTPTHCRRGSFNPPIAGMGSSHTTKSMAMLTAAALTQYASTLQQSPGVAGAQYFLTGVQIKMPPRTPQQKVVTSTGRSRREVIRIQRVDVKMRMYWTMMEALVMFVLAW